MGNCKFLFGNLSFRRSLSENKISADPNNHNAASTGDLSSKTKKMWSKASPFVGGSAKIRNFDDSVSSIV
jgi:hypothetical protein